MKSSRSQNEVDRKGKRSSTPHDEVKKEGKRSLTPRARPMSPRHLPPDAESSNSSGSSSSSSTVKSPRSPRSPYSPEMPPKPSPEALNQSCRDNPELLERMQPIPEDNASTMVRSAEETRRILLENSKTIRGRSRSVRPRRPESSYKSPARVIPVSPKSPKKEGEEQKETEKAQSPSKLMQQRSLSPSKTDDVVMVSFYVDEYPSKSKKTCAFLGTNLVYAISSGIVGEIRSQLENIIPGDREADYGLKVCQGPFDYLSLQILSSGQYGWFAAVQALLSILHKNELKIHIDANSLLRVFKAKDEKYSAQPGLFRQLLHVKDAIDPSAFAEENLRQSIQTHMNFIIGEKSVSIPVKIFNLHCLNSYFSESKAEEPPSISSDRASSEGSTATPIDHLLVPSTSISLVQSDAGNVTNDKDGYGISVWYIISGTLFALEIILLVVLAIFALTHGGWAFLPILALKFDLSQQAAKILILSVFGTLFGGSISTFGIGIFWNRALKNSVESTGTRTVICKTDSTDNGEPKETQISAAILSAQAMEQKREELYRDPPQQKQPIIITPLLSQQQKPKKSAFASFWQNIRHRGNSTSPIQPSVDQSDTYGASKVDTPRFIFGTQNTQGSLQPKSDDVVPAKKSYCALM